MSRPELPSLPGVLTGEQVLATARSIARTQESGGAIPWLAGRHADPWDHVECAMALSTAGLREPAERAYAWLRRTQRADGSWPAKTTGGVIEDPASETNQCAYVAVGVWHHLLVTGDERFALRMWPSVRAALDLVVGAQTDRGEVGWVINDGVVNDDALLAGSSSTYHSLRCALALADWVGAPQPEWELAAGRLAHVVAEHPEAFLDKSQFSMDWYYPVLGGVVRGAAGRARLDGRWADFVVPGLGARCVDDQPWVTGAETCELAIALATVGRHDDATAMVESVQHLRCGDGSYWTGWQFENRVHWPQEQSTWTAAAMVLAADALCGATPGSRIFHAESLPLGADLDRTACGCPETDTVGAAGSRAVTD